MSDYMINFYQWTLGISLCAALLMLLAFAAAALVCAVKILWK